MPKKDTVESMKYIPGLLQRQLPRWTGKKWYHQRFDGSPYFIHFIAEGEILTHAGRKKGGDFSVHFCFFEDGRADWYIEMGDIKKVYTAIIRAGRHDPHVSRAFITQWQTEQDVFYRTCKEVSQTDLRKLSDNELLALHDRFVQITLNKNSSSSLIDGFALGTDELLAQRVKIFHEKSPLGTTMKFAELFSALTAPVHSSFINEAELDLLRIALVVKKSKTKRQSLLSRYQKKYFWLRNNYVDSYVLSVGHFNEELDKVLEHTPGIDKEITRIIDSPNVAARKKEKLLKTIQAEADLRLLIKISEDFTYWQDERKKSTFWTTHYFSLILKEISLRTRLPLEGLKYLTPREVSHIFKRPPNPAELTARKKGCVAFWSKDGHEIISGPKVEKIKKAVLGEISLADVDDFRGLVAQTGTASGPVKVLRSAKEIDKVAPGDIIVAIMTRPDYVPAMKKAAAIITDEGGVTCHAAIISRELGLPCIIGTKIATKVLHDNDMVEVRANHGWVRILTHAKK